MVADLVQKKKKKKKKKKSYSCLCFGVDAHSSIPSVQ